MDAIITVVRIPLAIAAACLVVCSHLAHLVFETCAVVLFLPIAAVTMDRERIKQSWLSRYPHVIRNGYGNYQIPFDMDPSDVGWFILVLIPLALLLRLCLPTKGLREGLSTLATWVESDSSDGY